MPELKDFGLRGDYLAGSYNEPAGDRPDGGRWMVINVWKLDDNRIPAGLDAEPLLFYADFLFRNTNKADRERVQIIPSSDDNGKAYFFDREIRQYSIQGFVYDTKYDEQQVNNGMVPEGLSLFKFLYETKFRMSAAARQRLIIELDCDDFRLWGAMTNMVATHTSDTPSLFIITFGFWVEALEIKDTFKASDNLHISQESALKIGLVSDPMAVIPIDITQIVLIKPAGFDARQTEIERRLRNASVLSDEGSKDNVVVHPPVQTPALDSRGNVVRHTR